jgi:hypothetical protein
MQEIYDAEEEGALLRRAALSMGVGLWTALRAGAGQHGNYRGSIVQTPSIKPQKPINLP